MIGILISNFQLINLGGTTVMPGFSSMTWIPFSNYSEIICQLHDLSPKLTVINLLKDSFDKSALDANFRPAELGELTDERRQRLRIHISMQVLSLTVELTEDLAAICSAYSQAIKGNNKRIPEFLREFDSPDAFYHKASKDIVFAAEMVGYDPINDVTKVIAVQNIFGQIRDFRDKYKSWYNGYKHGQRTIPLAISFPSQPTGQNIHWGLYMIPEKFIEKNDQLFIQESVLVSTEEVAEYVRMAIGIIQLWQDVRSIQFPKVFGHIYPI
jgi:hypothetical protein